MRSISCSTIVATTPERKHVPNRGDYHTFYHIKNPKIVLSFIKFKRNFKIKIKSKLKAQIPGCPPLTGLLKVVQPTGEGRRQK